MVAGLSVILTFDGLGMEHIFEHFEKFKLGYDQILCYIIFKINE